MVLTRLAAPFCVASTLSQGGSTKNKLARVSGARLELNERELRLDITGGTAAVRAEAPPLPPQSSRPAGRVVQCAPDTLCP